MLLSKRHGIQTAHEIHQARRDTGNGINILEPVNPAEYAEEDSKHENQRISDYRLSLLIQFADYLGELV